MHHSRGWVDNWEWVRKWTRFCHRRILWIEGNQNSYLWGVFFEPPRNPGFVIGAVASLYFLIEKTNSADFFRMSSFWFDFFRLTLSFSYTASRFSWCSNQCTNSKSEVAMQILSRQGICSLTSCHSHNKKTFFSRSERVSDLEEIVLISDLEGLPRRRSSRSEIKSINLWPSPRRPSKSEIFFFISIGALLYERACALIRYLGVQENVGRYGSMRRTSQTSSRGSIHIHKISSK